MKCAEIIAAIEKNAPKELAYEWDNVGLLCGDYESEVSCVMLTLDLDAFVVREAANEGAQMIIGHHPIMFSPINKILKSTPEGETIFELIKNGISYYAAHTNLDIAKGGLNDLLAQKASLCDTKILEYTSESDGIGRIGFLKEPSTLENLCKNLKNTLGAGGVRFCGQADKLVHKIAVNTGGGTSLIEAAISAGADVFVTGDYKYNQMRDCTARGMCVVDIGHYDTEIIACELFYKYLSESFGDKVKIIKSEKNKNVMSFL